MTHHPLQQAQTPETVARRLLQTSAAHSFDPVTDIDWEAPLEEGAWFCVPERLSLYGTPLWEQMDQRQRIELSRHEFASLAGVGSWLELCLIQMLARYLTTRNLKDARTHYALTEMGDETRHITMFGMLHRKLDCPEYGPPAYLRRVFAAGSLAFQDLSTFALTLVTEELLDRFQREIARDERVQPLIRRICQIHVIEEARHVSFARTELRHAMAHASAPRRAFHRQLTALAASLDVPCLLDPALYRAVGLDPDEARRQARSNPHFRETMLWSGEKLIAFLTEVGMIGRAQHPWWRRAGLMR
ncbi:diiron oxygenase [Streptomyces sp. NPDC048604]|uniref:AurF N-oxygenase family protein n=1 Tax=Streptomyces sp. NPDC048604 TaxID=3365578 RepID=UPI003724768F